MRRPLKYLNSSCFFIDFTRFQSLMVLNEGSYLNLERQIRDKQFEIDSSKASLYDDSDPSETIKNLRTEYVFDTENLDT